MTTMKHIITIMLMFLLSVSTCQKKIDRAMEDNPTMISIDDTLTRNQLDSLFIEDTLSYNLESDWIQSSAISEDKKDIYYKYVYIKALTDSTGTIYTLCAYLDTLYIMNKKIIK